MSEEIPDKLSGNAGEDYAKEHLQEVKVHEVKWEILYVDPVTKQYWRRWSPQAELHGGGPPEFVKISQSEAREEFGIP